jgi:hypothetical protein
MIGRKIMKNIRVLCFLLAVFLGNLSVSRAQSFLTNGLIAYYPFSGNAHDIIGTNNGTVVGATLTEDRWGNTNGAYYFNGTNDFITFKGVPAIQTSNWTVTAWLNPASLNQYGTAVCVGFDNANQDGTTADGFAFGIVGNPNLSGNNLYGVFGTIEWLNGGYTFASSNHWYQVVMSHNSEGATFFVNGLETTNIAVRDPYVPTSFTIGSANGIRFFNGSINDVRIYNTSLAANEVEQLYALEQSPVSLSINTAVELDFFAVAGGSYQIQSSGDLTNWSNVGSAITGSNQMVQQFFSTRGTNAQFYQALLQ